MKVKFQEKGRIPKVCKNDQFTPETALLMNYTQARIHCNDSFYDFDAKNTIFDPKWKSTFEKHNTVFWTDGKLTPLSEQLEKVCSYDFHQLLNFR